MVVIVKKRAFLDFFSTLLQFLCQLTRVFTVQQQFHKGIRVQQRAQVL